MLNNIYEEWRLPMGNVSPLTLLPLPWLSNDQGHVTHWQSPFLINVIQFVTNPSSQIVYVLIFYLSRARYSKCSSLQLHTHNFYLDIFQAFYQPFLCFSQCKTSLPFFIYPFTKRLQNFWSIYKKGMKVLIHL